VPTPFGEVWLDLRPGGIVPSALATVPPTGVYQTSSPLNRGWALGTSSMWQAVLIEPSGLRMTMPAVPVMALY
jgi:hypothetical protein